MNYTPDVAGVTRHLATSSALNPTLILCAICTPVSSLFSYCTEGSIRLFFGVIAVAPVGLAVWQIIRFTLTDPDRLQNDRHVEAKMMIGRLGVKDGDRTFEVAVAPKFLVENPNIEREGE